MASNISNFNFAEMDWDAYELYRPVWPKELFEIIYDHHANHGNKLESALDVGAGGGSVSKCLLSKDIHVTYSDASDLYVSQAKLRFKKALDSNQMSFLNRKFEDLKIGDLSHGSVDLITAGECVHYADVTTFTVCMAHLLPQNGTLALFQYGIRMVLPEDDPAKDAYEKAQTRILRLFSELAHKTTKDSPADTKEARYDNVSFDTELWRNVRRIHTCVSESMCGTKIRPAHSRVRTQAESYEVLEDRFLSRCADYAWIENYMINLYPMLNFGENGKAELEDLRAATADRQIFLKWPLTLVLATRR